ncbi:MAG TPA: alpha-2-macroglobulin family protein, partial [Verrucomicrobiae bacterium]|nr:alpha-2-macroglobulin family protein [Verrucomicrobiae bacterium]
ASRREITADGTVRVTQQRYYVDATATHNLYRPQDKVTVDLHAQDANDQPVQTEGTVTLTRDYWYEVWLAPDGHEVKGEELMRLQAKETIWPPRPTKPNLPGWTLKFQGYHHDAILTLTLKTDTNGAATLEFKPEREGYYRVAWTSEDAIAKSKFQVANPITAETTVWVSKNSTTDLGYRHDGVEIIADKDTFRVGQRAPVMLVAPTSDRYVLFTVEGEDLYDYQLVHLEGTVKLIELPIEEKHVPNIFLGAALVSDRQLFVDSKQIVVPPTKNFLTVEVKPDASQHQPREDGTLTVTTKNDQGKPVSAEVALSFVDDSVFYVQSDYAGDPRQFYYGTKRSQSVQTRATMNQKAYTKLIEGKDELLIDERDAERQLSQKDESGDFDDLKKNRMAGEMTFSEGRFGGGGGGGFGLSTRAGYSRLVSVNGVSSSGMMGDAPVMAPAPMMQGGTFQDKAAELRQRKPSEDAGKLRYADEAPVVIVRSDFRSTIFWQPDVITDKDGKATVNVKYPDSLTSWKATARAVSAGNQFGIAEAITRTRQPLIVRLEAPRFFVVGDKVTVSAVVNNNTDESIAASVTLDAQGIGKVEASAKTIQVAANSEARADWSVPIDQGGDVKLKVTARGDKYADAMEKTFTAYEHGIEKFISKSGKGRANDFTVKLDLPHERKADSTTLTVQIAPSLAVTMLDSLPYLINYPYGCTEQTMSRFLPTVITAKTLHDMGLKPEDVMSRVFGGIETNSAAATHPDGKKNLDELDVMTQACLKRLYDFHHSDGGWGWWKEGDSDHWMTAYVVWGLSLARDAGVKIDEAALNNGRDYLVKNLVEEEENPDMQAWMLHALGAYYAPYSDQLTAGPISRASTNLWNRRDQLNAYTRALFALSQHYFHDDNRAKILVENLENGVIRDERPDTSILITPDTAHQKPEPSVMGTAHWGNDGIYWRWSDGGVEATAFALRALLAIDPTNQLVEPVSNWLVKNRRGAQWNNTRDTAITVLALNDYLRVSGELKPDLEYEVFVNGTSVATKKISGADVFNAPSRFTIDPKLIKDSNEIRIVRKNSDTPIYFAAEAKFFSMEEPITPAGSEIFVKREYFKLAGRQTLLKGLVYDREPLRDEETVKSGERVECVITIEAKNNYDYLLFEDLKPAGFEAVEVRSGESLYARELKSGAFAQLQSANPNLESEDFTGRQQWVYQELRDRQSALFIDHLPQGVWQIQYDYRAEVPGKFHALPVLGQAMYVPEIRANSSELRVNVEDAK